MFCSAKKLILSSKLSKTCIFVIIFSSFFILSDFIISYEDVKTTNKQLVDILKSSTQKLFSINKTKNVHNLTNEAIQNNNRLIKKLLCPPLGIYIHEPLAEFFFNILLYSKSLNFISNQTKANLITITCILMSFPIFILLNKDPDKQFLRRLACLLFQVRNILDFIDGKLARSDKNLKNEQDFDMGRVYDALGSSLPTLFFLLGSYIFILNTQNISNCAIEQNEISKLNPFYRTINKLMKAIKNRFGVIDKYSVPKVAIIKEIYCSLTLFTIYIIAAGIAWNQVLDSNKLIFADYRVLKEVSFQKEPD
jgi:hypothetical protein